MVTQEELRGIVSQRTRIVQANIPGYSPSPDPYIQDKLKRRELDLIEAREGHKNYTDSWAQAESNANIRKIENEIQTMKELAAYSSQGYSFSQGEVEGYVTQSGMQGYEQVKGSYSNQRLKEKALQQPKYNLPEGYKAVIVNGKITGVEDIKRGMSVPIENFQKYIDKYSSQITPPQKTIDELLGRNKNFGPGNFGVKKDIPITTGYTSTTKYPQWNLGDSTKDLYARRDERGNIIKTTETKEPVIVSNYDYDKKKWIKEEVLKVPYVEVAKKFTEKVVVPITETRGVASLFFPRVFPTAGQSALYIKKGQEELGKLTKKSWKEILDNPEREVEVPKTYGGTLSYSQDKGFFSPTQIMKVGGDDFTTIIEERKVETKLYPSGGTLFYTPEKGYYEPTQTKIITIEKQKVPTAKGYFVEGAGAIPELLGWIAAPEAQAYVSTLAAGERYKQVDIEADKILKTQYEGLLKETKLEEGYRYPTYEEFSKENKLFLSQELKSRYAQEAFGSTTALASSLFLRGYKYATKPIIESRSFDIFTEKYVQGNKPATRQFVAEIKVISPEENKTFLKIITSKPQVEYRITNKLREFLNLKPKVDWVPLTKRQLSVFEPVFGEPIPNNKRNYFGITTKVSKPQEIKSVREAIIVSDFKKTRAAKLVKISGNNYNIKDIDKDILKLSKTELNTLFRADLKLRPDVKVAVGRTGSVDTEFLLGLNDNSAKVYSVASGITPVGAEGKVMVYQTETFFSDITKPKPTLRGKIKKLPGVLVTVEVPEVKNIEFEAFMSDIPIRIGDGPVPQESFILTDTQGGFNWLDRKVYIEGTKNAELLRQLQLSKELQLTPVILPPVNNAVVVPKLIERNIEALPLMVGGTGITASQSDYWGTGKYELNELSFVPRVGNRNLVINKNFDRTIISPMEDLVQDRNLIPKAGVGVGIQVGVGVVTGVGVGNLVINKVINKNLNKTIISPMEDLTQKQTQIQSQSQIQSQIQIQGLKIKQAQALKLKTATTLQQKQIELIQKTPPVIPPIIGITTSSGKLLKTPLDKNSFTPEVRRKGKWIGLGKTSTLTGAREKAEQYTIKTLGASYRIKRGKDLVQLNQLGRMFAPSKREPKVYVQIKRTRLSARPEVSEIQTYKGSRKINRRRLKWI